MSAERARLAGPGARSYAFVIDWHIRVLAALAWLLAAALVWRPPWGLGSVRLRIAILPALAIYLLYHPVIETLCRGGTPGKRIAGLRVVASGGGEPSTAAILIRNALRAVDSLPLGYVVGLVTCFVRRDRARIGDLLAGTRVVDATPSERPVPAHELALQLLERWPALDPTRRTEIAQALLLRLEDRPAGAAVHANPPEGGDAELRSRLRAWAVRGTGEGGGVPRRQDAQERRKD